MKAPILLHIPEPCHENWDAMTPQARGRHCQSCNKVVVDFSIMSDRQVLDYFKNAKGNTCGRFHNDQLQRPLIEPQKQPSKWNYFVASFVSFFIGVKSFGQAKLQGKVAFPTQQTTSQTDELQLTKGEVVAPKLITVSGKVTDENGAAIAGASITIDKTNKGVVSDKAGNFLCRASSITNLTIRAANYETRRIQVKNNENLLIKLVYIGDSTEKVIVQVPYGVVKQTYFTGSAQTITAKQIQARQPTTFTKALEGILGEVSIVDNKFKGKIIDDKGTAIPDASIQIKGTKLGLTSKADGSFELNKLGSNTQLTIVVSSLGYETKTIEVESKDLKKELTIELKVQSQNLEEILLNTGIGKVRKRHYNGAVSVVSVCETKPSPINKAIIKPIQKLLNIKPVKIYPNPVAKNTNVYIAIKQTGTWELQLFNTQSNLLSVKEVIINTSNQVIEYTLPNNIASGHYFVRLINKESKKIITEQIIVL